MATHNEVAHAWAHQTGRARRGHHVFYEGDTIYSYGYHFPIARIDLERGVTLMTTRGYSVSTSKHKTIVRRAIVGPVLEVFDVAARGPHAHRQNAEILLGNIEEAYRKAGRRRSVDRKAWDLEEAEKTLDTLRRYVEAYDIPFAIPASIEAAGEVYAEFRRTLAETQRRQRVQAERDKRQHVKAWLRGERDHCPHTSKPYVRVKDGRVQTSWGVEVPLALALRVFRKVRDLKAAGELVQPVKLGPFMQYGEAVVVGGGELVIGCHRIPYWRGVYAACKAELL